MSKRNRNLFEIGDEVGELTVEALSEKDPTRYGRFWYCRCQCGAPQVRSSVQLNGAIRDNTSPMCPRCLSEWRRGMSLERDAHRRSGLARHFETTRSLYGHGWDERFENGYRAALCAELGPMAALDEPRGDDVEPYSAPSTGGINWPGLYPMSGFVWKCEQCKKKRSVGWGCVDCMTWACRECVTAGNCCRCLNREGTLEFIGKHFGVTRERMRQVEAKALRKMQNPKCTRLLAPFVELDNADRVTGRFSSSRALYEYAELVGYTPAGAILNAIRFNDQGCLKLLRMADKLTAPARRVLVFKLIRMNSRELIELFTETDKLIAA